MERPRVLDRYEIAECLGSGGCGVVHRAWDPRLERDVAVKVVDAATSAAAERIKREARAAARLNHPGIVTLYELGMKGSRAYLVSELVPGPTLAALRDAGGLTDRDTGDIGVEVADALAHAHARGVVHRDVKPQNVLIAPGPAGAKLTDFGIARLAGAAELTATGAVLGTIAYMAPEQAEGGEVGAASDVYSLALSLYELWAGHHPVAAGSPAETARRIGRPIAPLARVRPDLPRALTAAIDGALQADPARRPDAGELREAVRDCLPVLDAEGAVRALPASERLARTLSLAGRPALRMGLLAIAGTAAAAGLLAWIGGAPPAWAWIAAACAGPLWALAPRIGYPSAAAGLVAWAWVGAAQPGQALLLAAVAVLPPLLAPRAGRAWGVPALAPAASAAGLAALFPAAAGLADRAAERAGLAICGFVWLAVAEAVTARTLAFGVLEPLPAGWEASVGKALSALGGLADPAALLGIGAWALAAVLLPMIVRGRSAMADALGALVWCAGLIWVHRAFADVGLQHTAAPPVVLLAVVLAALVPGAVWRRARVMSPGPAAPPVDRGPTAISAYD